MLSINNFRAQNFKDECYGVDINGIQGKCAWISTFVGSVLPRPISFTPAEVALPVYLPRPGITNDYVPGLSSKRIGEKADDIWGGFRQGNTGNCVTVSAIKAAMTKFGQHPSSIFSGVQKTPEGYQVRMRDGFELMISDRELSQAISGARFIGRDTEMLKDAHFLFAVSAKRAQMENNDGTAWRSFQAAIHSLNNGEDERRPGEALERLGLRQHMRRVSVRDLAQGQLGICNRRGHSTAVINGREELWGHKGSYSTHGDAVALM